MVKRSRDQSQETPSLRSCRTMRPPYSFFHAQARSRNFSRPMSSLEMPSALRASTTLISVAMEAWSVPGTQRVGSPFMRW